MNKKEQCTSELPLSKKIEIFKLRQGILWGNDVDNGDIWIYIPYLSSDKFTKFLLDDEIFENVDLHKSLENLERITFCFSTNQNSKTHEYNKNLYQFKSVHIIEDENSLKEIKFYMPREKYLIKCPPYLTRFLFQKLRDYEWLTKFFDTFNDGQLRQIINHLKVILNDPLSEYTHTLDRSYICIILTTAEQNLLSRKENKENEKFNRTLSQNKRLGIISMVVAAVSALVSVFIAIFK